MSDLSRGTQIIYLPGHAGGDVNHPDCERGFVTSVEGETVFCRYWREDLKSLRTLACSEGCRVDMLVRQESVPQALVEYQLTQIEADRDLVEVKELEQKVREKLGNGLTEDLREAFFAGRDPLTKAKLFGLRYSRKGGIVR